MGGIPSVMETAPPSHPDSEETRQVTREALQQKAALEDKPQREKTRSSGHRQLEANGQGRRGEEKGGKISLSTDVPWPPPRQRGADFLSCPQAPASATLFTSCLFIVAGSEPGMGLCDLYDYKPPKGTESWQGVDRDRGRPPKVKMATLPPLLTLYPIRPSSGKEEMNRKPQLPLCPLLP